MSQVPVVAVGNTTAVVLPAEALVLLGVKAGDWVDVSVQDHQLVVRLIDQQSRKQKVEEAIQDVLQRRSDAYQRLAQGP